MRATLRWQRFWTYAIGVSTLAFVGYGIGRQIGTRRLQAAPPPRQAALPPDPLREADSESVILAQRKRVMGRLRSLESVRRVATAVRPLVDRALEMPQVQGDLRILADSMGVPVQQYKRYFAGKQEADLLLESGGDPNAHSVSDAIGVAQFLASTGQRCGLKVNLSASRSLSRKIAAVEEQIGWLEGQSPGWARAVPPALKGIVPTLPAGPIAAADASLVPAPTPAASSQPQEGVWTRDQWLAYRRSQRQNLVAKRRQVDHRYDPAKAIAAQTKYLVRLTRRYGGVDWALQAYHGGEAGAARTMRLFASGGDSRALLASRNGGYVLGGRGRWLPYTEVYRRITPTGTPAAFGYLFGRSDDHRYYWWKVLMAERALNLYRKNTAEFERQWQALQPGYSADMAYYPEPAPLQFRNNADLRQAYQDASLVFLPANATALGIRTQNLAALEPTSAGLHKGLRPEAMGALLRLAHLYISSGGREGLTLLTMVQTMEYRSQWDARYPDPPLPPNVPKDPEFHTTGLTFDLKRPTEDWDRKVLEFALGRLYDNLRISWRHEREAGSRRYHVVINPQFKDEMIDYYRKATR
jgi:hypothetical protein